MHWSSARARAAVFPCQIASEASASSGSDTAAASRISRARRVGMAAGGPAVAALATRAAARFITRSPGPLILAAFVIDE
ncbi:hypothetical protein ACFQU2_21635 [Siccirubricoccus deserti]